MAKNQSVEHEIRNAIVRGALAPSSRLRMEDLRSRFDVGFSPIREALSRLVSEGLVELEPNKGFRVAAMSRRDLEDIAISRLAVERMALQRSLELGDDRWEANLVGAMHHYRLKAECAFQSEETLLAWESAHDTLHLALIGACASPRLLDMQRRLQHQHLRYRRLIVIPQVEATAHVEEHEKLVALALRRDIPGALIEIEMHLRITVDALSAAHFWDNVLVDATTG